MLHACIKEGILKPEHYEAGLTIEDDEDCVYLKRGEKAMATWCSTAAPVVELWAEADKYL